MILLNNQVKKIEIDLTGVCNLSCYICTRNYKHAQNIILPNIRSFKKIKEQFDQFSALVECELIGTCSEPTLYPQLFELIRYLKQRKVRIDLNSNGNTHDREWWKKLSQLLTPEDKVIFTVCGSTQELHSYYRVGSSLQQILDNASAFRESGNKNDYCQHILFEYNEEDLKSGNMECIFKQFSHVFSVISEGHRLIEDKKIISSCGINPPYNDNIKINYIYKLGIKDTSEIKCRSLVYKSIYISQFGNIYPCSKFYEYEQFGYNDVSKIPYSSICDNKYQCCSLCKKNILKISKKIQADFIC